MAARRASFPHLLRDREVLGSRAHVKPEARSYSSEIFNPLCGFVQDASSDGPMPPLLALSFSQRASSGHCLAVGAEDGNIAVSDTSSYTQRGRPDAKWQAHNNAIFDVLWTKADSTILTASGDQTIVAWDVEKQQAVARCQGHTGSVKAICVQPAAEDCFASGARDGSVLLWDMRTAAAAAPNCSRPCAEIKDAHAPGGQKRLLKRSRRVQGDSKKSVTAVLYLQDGHMLATAGAADGVVKFWDLRALKVPAVVAMQQCASESSSYTAQERIHGITSLSQDSSGTRLTASSNSGSIYLLDPLELNKPTTALRKFSGHQMGSFYIKAKLSIDGESILSGSADGGVYVWQVSRPESPPAAIHSHQREVTAVDWCPSDPCKFTTCSDDSTVRLWTLSPSSRTRHSVPLQGSWLLSSGYPTRSTYRHSAMKLNPTLKSSYCKAEPSSMSLQDGEQWERQQTAESGETTVPAPALGLTGRLINHSGAGVQDEKKVPIRNIRIKRVTIHNEEDTRYGEQQFGSRRRKISDYFTAPKSCTDEERPTYGFPDSGQYDRKESTS